MAFILSRAQSEPEKVSLDPSEKKDSATVGPISSQLYLKSASKASPQTLDKEVVLRRIRHRKSLNKVKSTSEALLGSSEANTASTQEHKWLEQDDAFSAP